MRPRPHFPADEARFRDRACPRDHTPLAQEQLTSEGREVTIDRCAKCQGMFLDKNELLKLTGDSKLNKYLRDEVALDSDSALICPHCGGIMDLEAIAGAEVEVCLSCYGLWLDRDEFEALRDRRNEEQVPLTPEKQRELEVARKAGGQARESRLGPQPKDAVGKARRGARGMLDQYDQALSEFVRRYM